MSVFSYVWGVVQILVDSTTIAAAFLAGVWGYNQASENFLEGALVGVAMSAFVVIFSVRLTGAFKRSGRRSAQAT